MQGVSRRTRGIVTLVIILAVGAALRFWGLDFGLPHRMSRPDEEGLIVPAIRMVGGQLNPHWFHWPSLAMYILSVPYALYIALQRARGAAIGPDLVPFYAAHPSPFHLIDRAFAAACGTLTIYLVYRLARLYFPRRASTLAAVFLAVAPLHVRDSHFGVTDVPATLLVVAAVYAAARWRYSSSRTGLWLAAAVCGLAASTKYNAALVLAPLLLAVVMRAREDREGVARAAYRCALAAGIAAVAFVVGTPFAVLSPAEFMDGLRAVSGHLSAGHGLDLGPGWTYHPSVTLRYGLGTPLLVAGVAGSVWFAIARPDAAIQLLAFPAVYYLAIGPSRVVFFRYALPLVPFLCIGAGYAVGRLPRAASLALAGVLALSCVPDIVRSDRLLARTDTRVLAADWITSRIPGTATFYASGAFYGHVELPPRFAPAQIDARPDLIIVQQSPLMYSGDVPAVLETAQRDYEQTAEFVAYDPAATAGNVYDQLDAFYLPLRGLRGIERPGPTISVWQRRRDAQAISAAGRR
jgi:4-amino-4-deoxy-L-arabinose transferase-like glycosyltransferase